MTTQELEKIRQNLDLFVAEFADCIKTAPSRRHLRTYVRGQVSDLDRKSIEPIATAAGVPPRTLQEFMEIHLWDEKQVASRLRELVMRDHADENAIAVIDETGYPKKGDKTAGVQRQHCGASGKQDNCVISVNLTYATESFHTLIDGDLYLPEETWHEDRRRCRLAGIPDEVVYRPKWKIALELLERSLVADSVRCKYLTADELYGGCSGFRAGVAERGLQYVVEIPKNTHGWTKKPRFISPNADPRKGKLRLKPSLTPGSKAARRVDKLWLRGGPKWEMFHVKNTEKGAVVWEVRATRFYANADGFSGAELLVARNVLSGEVKYFLSNAPRETRIEELLYVAFSRWRIERCYEDAKGEVGLDHFEVRKHLPLMRHLVLSMLSLLFLMRETVRLRESESWWSARQVRRVVEAQLDPTICRCERNRRLEKLVRILVYTHQSRCRASRSHARRRSREYESLGIDISRLRKCFQLF